MKWFDLVTISNMITFSNAKKQKSIDIVSFSRTPYISINKVVSSETMKMLKIYE